MTTSPSNLIAESITIRIACVVSRDEKGRIKWDAVGCDAFDIHENLTMARDGHGDNYEECIITATVPVPPVKMEPHEIKGEVLRLDVP